MDGLLPMVFKAIKKSKTRRRYECLSSGTAQGYNVADFYGGYDNNSSVLNMTHTNSAEKKKITEEKYSAHRRHKSVGDFYVGYGGSGGGYDGGYGGGSPPPKQKQLVRFRSNRMFSCVTGAS